MRIQSYRTKLGFNRAEMAAILGIPPYILERWEQNIQRPTGGNQLAVILIGYALRELPPDVLASELLARKGNLYEVFKYLLKIGAKQKARIDAKLAFKKKAKLGSEIRQKAKSPNQKALGLFAFKRRLLRGGRFQTIVKGF